MSHEERPFECFKSVITAQTLSLRSKQLVTSDMSKAPTTKEREKDEQNQGIDNTSEFADKLYVRAFRGRIKQFDFMQSGIFSDDATSNSQLKLNGMLSRDCDLLELLCFVDHEINVIKLFVRMGIFIKDAPKCHNGHTTAFQCQSVGTNARPKPKFIY